MNTSFEKLFNELDKKVTKPNNEGHDVHISDLKFGDIVWVKIPYVENDPISYNGYSPKRISGNIYRDKNGYTGKVRPAMVIGTENNNIIYAYLSSRKPAERNKHFWHEVQNLENIPRTSEHSYVQCSEPRSLSLKTDTVRKIGYLHTEDIQLIKDKMNSLSTTVITGYDAIRYMNENTKQQLIDIVNEKGYEKTEKGYTNGHVHITINETGIIRYHFPLSVQEVRERTKEMYPHIQFKLAVEELRIKEMELHKNERTHTL